MSKLLRKTCGFCRIEFTRYASEVKKNKGVLYCSQKCAKEARQVYLVKYRDLYRQRDKERDYTSKLMKRYGITAEQYSTMLTAQGGRCAICGNPQPNKRRLSVDHDHTTGKVRSLLCSFCNRGLGYFQDSTNLLSKAMEYLADHHRLAMAGQAPSQ